MGGGVYVYAAQPSPQIDDEIAENSRFRTETDLIYSDQSFFFEKHLTFFTEHKIVEIFHLPFGFL